MTSLLERVRKALAPHYLVERVLGEGGMGAVFLAHDSRLDRQVAVKVLKPELATATAVARFLREARLQDKLRHPNIIRVYHADEDDGIPYYVMEYLEGETLKARLESGPLPPGSVRALGRALLAALGEAHSRQIVHRDVKPANVFLVGDRIVLADFGVAHTDDGDTTTLTTTGQLVGTRRYMAPEQLAGCPATVLSDLYSTAMVLYEASTGRPWTQTTPPDAGDWAGVPRRLASALRRGLEIDPGRRWQSVGEFRAALAYRSRRALVVLVTAAAVVLLAGSVGTVVCGAPARRAPEPPRVRPTLGVVPFADGGDGSAGRQLARHVATQLEWFRRWDFVLRDSALSLAAGRVVPDPITRLRAEGDIVERGADTVLQLVIREGERLEHVVEVPGSRRDLLGWARSIADSIVRRTFPQYADEFRYYAQRTSRNVPAHEALITGQDAFRRDGWAEAEAHFRRALEHDPRFAQAAWHLALIRKWRRDSSHTLILRQLYDSQRDDLPPLQRLLTEAELDPDLHRRIALFAEAARRYPQSTDASLLFGNELYHRGPLIGIPLDSGIAVLESTARRETFSTARVHAVLGHIRLGNRERAAGDLALLPAAPHDDEARMRALLLEYAYDERFRPVCALRKRWGLQFVRDAGLMVGLYQYTRLANFFDIPVAQATLGGILARNGAEPAVRASGMQGEGLSLMLRGRSSAALVRLDSAAALLGTDEASFQTLEWRALLPALGLPGDPAAARAAETRLAAIQGALAARAAWALAVAAHRRGDAASASAWAESLSIRTQNHTRAAPLSRLVSALALASRGAPDSALRASESLLQYDPGGIGGDPFARAILHTQRAAWQRQTGDAAAAERTLRFVEAWDLHEWPQREVQSGEVDVAIGAVARLHRAALAAAAGRFSTACRLAARVGELWADAEPPYAPLRDTAHVLAKRCAA